MRRKLFKAWVVAATLLALPGVAMADIFMLVTGVAGDATAKGHEGWIRVSGLQWNVEANTSWTTGSGASVGKPLARPVTLTLPTGIWSQHFVRLITQGKALPKVTIDATALDGRPLYRATVEGMYVTDYELASLAASPLPQDKLEFVFKILKIEYYAIGADGKLITTSFEWNVTTGIVTPAL